MCGLLGVQWRQPDAMSPQAVAERLGKGLAAIAHRGPDDDGTWQQADVALGFRRLSILDLTSAGHQPMLSQDGDWVVVFNGEIYNFLELAKDLIGRGVVFRSHSDTEVLVEGLARFGPVFFSRLNGMWGVLAYQKSTRTLYASRDPWGIKPLYTHASSDGVWIASEIKALRAAGCDLGQPDAQVLAQFIAEGELDTDARTSFSHVQRLEPGILYVYRNGELARSERIAAPDQGATRLPAPRNHSEDQAFTEAFRQAFLQSVALRLRADVPIGSSLSGGLDSTSVLCAAARQLDAERTQSCRHAFTALMPEYDESLYIRAVIEQTGAQWHVVTGDDQTIAAAIEPFLAMHDEPVHSLAPLAGYLVMRLVRDAGVKVVFNGQGADELLAGYPSTIIPALRTRLQQEGLVSAWRDANAEASRPREAIQLLIKSEGGRVLAPLLSRLSPLLEQLPVSRQPAALLRPGLDRASATRPQTRGQLLQDVLESNLRYAPLPLFLRIEDQNSSAFSVEARLPFLDPQLVALANAAPARLLRSGGLNKLLLRKILPGLVPAVVHERRDKMGFPVPASRWMRGPLRPLVARLMTERRLAERGWYDVPAVLAERDRMLAGAEASPALKRVFHVESWFAAHFGQ